MISALHKLLKSHKPKPAKAPYALVAPLALEGRLNKTKVLDIFESAEDAYREAQRLELMAIHVPTLAHVGKVIHEVDIGKVYPTVRRYTLPGTILFNNVSGAEKHREKWAAIATSPDKALMLLEATDEERRVLKTFLVEETDS